MNKDVHASLKSTVVNSVSIDLDPDKLRKGNITLSVEGKTALRVPKEEDDFSILLVSSMEIKSQEDEDTLHASFVVNFFFSIDEKLDNYDEIVTKQCLPTIRTEIKNLANKFLHDMGFSGVFEATGQNDSQ